MTISVSSFTQKEKQLMLHILSFFFFYFGLNIINDKIFGYIGNPYGGKIFYPLALICIAIGYSLFPFVYNISSKAITRQKVFIFVSVLFLLLYLFIILDYQSLFSLLVSYAAIIAYGYIGGFIHYSMALSLSGNPFTGRIIGLVTSFAVLLKYFIKQFNFSDYFFHLFILTLVLLSLYLTVKAINKRTFEDLQQKKLSTNSHIVIKLVILIILMLLIISLNFSIIYRESFTIKNIPMSSQLFFASGLLCAGFLADIKKRHYFTKITIYALIFMTVMVCASTIPELYAIRYFTLYFFIGFFVVYLIVAFMDFAPNAIDSVSPPLFSVLGRIIQSTVTAGIIILLGIWTPSEKTLILTCSILLAFCTLFLFLIGNNISRQSRSEQTTSSDSIPEEVYIQNFAESNQFTDREQEVFTILITTEKTLQEVANELYISRRVLQRYITSIYKKTDTKTRIGLLQLYLSKRTIIHTNNSTDKAREN